MVWQLSTTYVLLYKEVEQIASAEDSTMVWQLSRRTICRKKEIGKVSKRRRLDHGLATVNDLCLAAHVG